MIQKAKLYPFGGEMLSARQVRERFTCYSEDGIRGALKGGVTSGAELHAWFARAKARERIGAKIGARNFNDIQISKKANGCPEIRQRKAEWAERQRAMLKAAR